MKDYREGGYTLVDYRVRALIMRGFRERKTGKGTWSGYHQ